MYTDASDLDWAGIPTQMPILNAISPRKEQRRSPISFLSGRFRKTQIGWSGLEKEAYAVMNNLDRMR